MIRRAALAVPPLALLMTLPTHAGETRHAQAHVHGVSKLQVAVEGARVDMELRSPGADIVGFEHAAESEADRAAVAAALKRLGDPAPLFGVKGCRVEAAEAAMGGEEAHGESHDEDHGAHHDEDGGAHKDDHGEHDDDHGAHHEDHDGDRHEDAPGHAEFRATYALTCAEAPAALDLSGFFAAFPRAAEVEIEALADRGVFVGEARPDAPRLDLR